MPHNVNDVLLILLRWLLYLFLLLKRAALKNCVNQTAGY